MMTVGSILLAMSAQAVTLENRIVRAAPAGEDAAGYVAIANPGPADRLVGVSCDCADAVEIHRMVRDGGRVSMEKAASLPVPAGGVEIRPGSDLHLMLLRLRAPLADGQSVPLTLRFERAGTVVAAFVAVQDTAAAWRAAPALAPELQPLGFLVGGCWRATFPGGSQTDTHCYTPMLGGRLVRDRHVVEGASEPYSGETIYRWDPEARRIRYDYYASDGGTSAGSVEPTPAGLDFPRNPYLSGTGERMTLRNALTREGETSFSGVSAMRQGETWREMWRMRFERVSAAPAD